RQASVTSCPRSLSKPAKTVPQDPQPTTRAFTPVLSQSPERSEGTSRIRGKCAAFSPANEVDRHGHALQLEPLTQLILDPVAVVACDQAAVVDEEPEARRADAGLGAVEQVELPA